MAVPHKHTSELAGYNLLTWGAYQFAVWYTTAGELKIGRIQRGVQRWGINHVEYEFASTPRTQLALPVADDEHNYPTVALDNRGFIHVWANMHDNPIRCVKTTGAHTTDGWLATAGWAASPAADFPSIEARCSYPIPVHFNDNGLLFFIRDLPNAGGPGGSGKSDTHFYTRHTDGASWISRVKIFQGLAVPNASPGGGPGSGDTVDDETNWSAYPTVPVVEPQWSVHPGRMHMSWVWRTWQSGTQGAENVMPGYAYSDDRGVTWKTVTGTAVTLPITPLNSITSRFPWSAHVESISRTSNVVTAELDMTSSQHGIIVGETITIDVTDATYNGDFVVTTVGTPNPTSVQWAQVVANDADGGKGAITNEKLSNWGSVAIDEDGMPHILCSSGPSFHIYRNDTNTGWVRDEFTASKWGFVHQVRPQAFWRRGNLWWLKVEGSSAYRQWYPRAWQLTGGQATFRIGGEVDAFGKWEPAFDPEAYRRFGSIEVLTPVGNKPQVAVFGRGSRTVAA